MWVLYGREYPKILGRVPESWWVFFFLAAMGPSRQIYFRCFFFERDTSGALKYKIPREVEWLASHCCLLAKNPYVEQERNYGPIFS